MLTHSPSQILLPKEESAWGYVAEMRQKDLNICSPFLVNGSETQPSFPPLVVQRFRSWSCNLCLGGNEFNVGYQSDQRTCYTGIQETLTDKSVHARNEIDINKLIDLTGDSDEEEKNDAEVSIDEITDLDPELENDLNHQVSNNVESSYVCPSLIQKMHANQIDIVPEHIVEQFPQEPTTEDNVDAGNSDENGGNENVIQDLHQKNSSKKFKRMRFVREILREGNEPIAKQIRRGRPTAQNPSSKFVDSQRQETIMDKVVGEGDTKKLKKKGESGRKRKLLLDEDEDEDGDDAPLSDFIERVENRVSNMPVYSVSCLAQNEEGWEEGLHLSSSSSPQTLLRPIQEGPGETDSTGERICPLTSAFSREGRGVHIEEIDQATREHDELEALDALLQISQNNTVIVEPETQIKQFKEMDFDLNLPYYYQSTDREMLNGKIGLGISIDLNVAIGGSDLNPGECSKTKMDIIGSSQTFGSLKGKLSEKSHTPTIFDGNFNGRSAYGWLNQEEEEEEETPTQHCGGTHATPVSLNNNIFERFCGTNRNPADFTPFEAGNPYMREEKDKVRKRVSGEKRCGSSSKQNKKP
ncbi:hypothetical protein VNO80_05951 [Phaseolus coccineus]|uniref:Uncharacterized protein n=1 Tax=Phaseolus coccineus TaxID=3886 RepID=A0AAN9NH70_PHACN